MKKVFRKRKTCYNNYKEIILQSYLSYILDKFLIELERVLPLLEKEKKTIFRKKSKNKNSYYKYNY